MSIAFVCSQNKLRSVLASEALRAKRPDLTIESGGIPKEGRKFACKADKRAREIIQSRYDVSLSDYRSQAGTEEMIEGADRFFVFSEHNHDKLVEHFPSARSKIELFCDRSGSDWNVNPVEIFEQYILPAVEHWARLL
jgi:protein-tyrosine-phosphatase